ncbi:MAG: phage tail tape measure protein [Pseudobacteriovorax sp.]|nr:phage tail tape measure protein [Pseudobacteriovorax sp.]
MAKREVSFSVRAVDRATAVINKVTRSLEKSTAPLRKMEKLYDRADKSTKRYTKTLDRLKDKLSDIGKSATIGLTLPIAAVGATSIKTAADFEQSMKKVETLTGGEMFDELKSQAREFGATTMHSASSAADAMVFFSMAGFRALETYKAMPSTLNLATAATTDLATAADVVTSVLRGYNLPVSDIQDMTDMMTGAFASAKMDLATLGESLTKAGPLMAQIGVEFSETLAIIGKLRDAGIDASSVGTAIAGGVARLIKPVKEVSDRIKKLLKMDASELVDSNGKLGSFVGLIERLEKAGAGADDFLAIFGQEAGRYLLNLRGMSRSVRELQRTIESSTGKTKEFADAFQSGATGAMYAFRSAVEAVQISIGESGLLSDFTDLTNGVTSYIQRLSEANPAMIRLATIILGITAIIGPFTLGLAGLVATIAGAIINFKLLTVVLAMMGTTVGAAFAAIALKALIIGTVIGGLVYAGWWLYDNWNKIIDTIGGWIDYVLDKLRDLGDWFVDLRGDKKYGLQRSISVTEEGFPSIQNAELNRKLSLDVGPIKDLPNFDSKPSFQADESLIDNSINWIPDWMESLGSTVNDAFANPIFKIDEKKLVDEEKLGKSIKLSELSIDTPPSLKRIEEKSRVVQPLSLYQRGQFGEINSKLPNNIIPLVRSNIQKADTSKAFESERSLNKEEKVSIDVNFSNLPCADHPRMEPSVTDLA